MTDKPTYDELAAENEAQAVYIAKLRAACRDAKDALRSNASDREKANAIHDINEALSHRFEQPVATRDARIRKEAMEEMRERCAQTIEGGSFLHNQSPAARLAKEAATAIRALPIEQEGE